LAFTTSRQIAANTAKVVGALLQAETAGDFLLQLGHTDVVLALIFGERHLGIVHEPERFGLVAQQPLCTGTRDRKWQKGDARKVSKHPNTNLPLIIEIIVLGCHKMVGDNVDLK
jgi:hypothetical protein